MSENGQRPERKRRRIRAVVPVLVVAAIFIALSQIDAFESAAAVLWIGGGVLLVAALVLSIRDYRTSRRG